VVIRSPREGARRRIAPAKVDAMHNASTKQRIAALRRRLGIFTGWQPRWVRERRRRLERLALAAGGGRIAEAPAPADEAPTEMGTALLHPPPRAAAMPDPEPERVPAPPRPAAAAPAPQPATAAEPAPTLAEPARATHAGPAKPPPAAATLAAPPRRREAGAARGAAVVVAVLALAAALLLALGRRGPDAPVDPAGLERAPSRDPVVVAALAPSPGPGPAAAPRAPRGEEGPGASIVEVRRGDTLWHLAAVHLGDPMRWPELHAANAHLIRDPDLILPGQRLDVPRTAQL
jgi:nucleoid-associated protein YgaU